MPNCVQAEQITCELKSALCPCFCFIAKCNLCENVAWWSQIKDLCVNVCGCKCVGVEERHDKMRGKNYLCAE